MTGVIRHFAIQSFLDIFGFSTSFTLISSDDSFGGSSKDFEIVSNQINNRKQTK